MRFISRFFLVLASCAVCLIGFLQKSLIVNADVVPAVTLTPEQTLALYGTSLPAVYRDGSTWKSCTFQFHSFGAWDSEHLMPVTDTDLRGGQPSGFSSWADYINYTRTIPRLYYVCAYSDAPYSSPTIDQIKFQITPTLDISGILYYRQNFMMGKYSSSNYISNTYCNTSVSYSASPITSYAKGWDNLAAGYIKSWYVGDGSQSNINTGFKYDLIDIYLENLVDGVQQEFSVSGQSLSYSRCGTATIPNGEQDETYYVLSIQCPTVSDGFVVPDSGGSGSGSPDYSGQLGDINVSINTSNTILGQILAKLDLIYANMNINTTVNISSSSISSLGNTIKNLFVPSSSSWFAFRLNMHGLLESKFSAFFDAEDEVHDFYSSFDNISPVSSIRFPGVSVALPTGSGSDSAVFSIASQDVSLKPADEDGKLAPLYECLAVIVDFVCTLAFVNMIRTRFFHVIEGGGENDY